ncbi:MAG TPA: tetratricopeptide repeat protein [Acidimicrobiales bacterium]
MEIVLSVVVAVAIGVVWVLVLRRAGRRRTISGAPKDVRALLSAYQRAQWAVVADGAPEVLARPSDGADQSWRPALELALGQSLVELDRCDEAIGHLERGLLLQAAVRRSRTGGDTPDPGEAKLRHLLGWAYADTGRTAQARKEYRRILDVAGLDPAIRTKVEASLEALDR